MLEGMRDTSTGITNSFQNTDITGSEIRSSKPAMADSSSDARRLLNDSLEPGDSVPRSIPGGKTLESSTPVMADSSSDPGMLLNDGLESGDSVP